MKFSKKHFVFALFSLALFPSAFAAASNLYVGRYNSREHVAINSNLNFYSNTFVGYDTGASKNQLKVANSNTFLINSNDVFIGYQGSKNTMALSSGSHVIDSNGYIGYSNGSSNNSVLVSGSQSTWTNRGDLYVGYAGSGNSLFISKGGHVYSDQYSYIGYTNTSSDNGVFITDTNSLWNAGSYLTIGNGGSTNNTLVIRNGAVVNTINGTFIGDASYAHGNNRLIVTGYNSTLSNSGGIGFRLGDRESGDFAIVANGAKLYGANDVIGYGDEVHAGGGNDNTLIVTGSSSLYRAQGGLVVGYQSSNNQLVINNGATAIVNGATIGYLGAYGITPIGDNRLLVTGTNSILDSSSLGIFIGSEDNGDSIVVSNGAKLYGKDDVIGYNDGAGGSNNSLIITGSNSLYSNSSDLYVGEGDTGGGSAAGNSLVISNGAVATIAGTTWVGYSGGDSNNCIVVTGAGSRMSNGGSLYLGFGGSSNSMLISDGGNVYNANGYIGHEVSGVGNLVTVTGSNSAWINSGNLYVGFAGQSNRLVISSGGFVSDVNGFDDGASTNDAFNSVLVTGAGSRWSNSGNLTFGLAGHDNSLVVSKGGNVTVAGDSVIGDYSTATNNSVLVTGAGSLLSNSGTFTIGNEGGGTLTVADGGKIIAGGGIVLASTAGSVGTLNIGTGDGGGFFGGDGGSQVAIISPTITFGSGAGVINFLQSDYSYSTNLHGFEYHPFVLSSDISGNGSLNQLQAFGTTILTGSNSYTGVTSILDGSIEFSGTQSLYGGDTNKWTAANLIVSDNATAIFTVGGSNPFSEGDLSQLLSNASSTNGFLDGARLGIDTTGTNFTYASNLTDLNGGSNSLSLVVLGTGTLNLTGSNNYSGLSLFYGGTTVVSGSINYSSNNGSFVDLGLLNYSGALVVTNGGSLNASNGLVVIGALSSVSNSVTVTGTNGGNHSLLVAHDLFVGSAIVSSLIDLQYRTNLLAPSSGNSLVVSNGGWVRGDNPGVNTNLCLVGFLSPSNSVTVTGTNTAVGFSVIAIGAGGGANRMLISNQAGVYDVYGVVGGLANVLPRGQNPDSNSVIVTGAGSSWVNADSLAIGGTGILSTVLGGGSDIYNGSSHNSLTISNGGYVSSSNGYVGGLNCLNNTVNIVGAGSLWSNSSTLYVGWKGASDNSLIVSDGGKLISAAAFIGYTNSSNGVSEGNSVLVTGTGSLWTNAGSIVVGRRNTLIIADGGTVSASNVEIKSGGIFTGSGGILNGDLTIMNGGKYVLQNPVGLTSVNGTATLNGTLVISSPLAFGTKATFLNATSIVGSFDSIIAPAGERGRLVIEGDPTASVIIAPASYTQLAQNRNQLNVATALNSFISYTSGDQLTVSTTLDSLTASQYNQAFNAIMPTFYQQIATVAFNQANAQNMELNQRLWGLRVAEGGGFSMSGIADNYAMLQEGIGDGQGASEGKGVLDSKKDILRPGLDNRWGMFVDGNGIFAQANSANMLPGYNSESGGVTTGLTYKWNKNVASGIYAGYQGTYTKSGANGSGLGTGSSLIDNAVRFGVFGTYGQENGKGLYANALAGGAYHNLQANRVIQFTGLDRTANSAPGAGELDTMLATGYDLQKGNFTYGPTASLQYTYLGVNSVNETGAQSLNFNSGGWNSSSMLSSVGAHAAYNWQAGKNVLVVPQISLNWQHEFMQNPYVISGNLGGTSPTFGNWSATGIRDYLYTGVGFTVEFGKRWNTAFFYNAAAGNSDLVSQNIFWSAGVKF